MVLGWVQKLHICLPYNLHHIELDLIEYIVYNLIIFFYYITQQFIFKYIYIYIHIYIYI